MRVANHCGGFRLHVVRPRKSQATVANRKSECYGREGVVGSGCACSRCVVQKFGGAGKMSSYVAVKGGRRIVRARALPTQPRPRHENRQQLPSDV